MLISDSSPLWKRQPVDTAGGAMKQKYAGWYGKKDEPGLLHVFDWKIKYARTHSR